MTPLLFAFACIGAFVVGWALSLFFRRMSVRCLQEEIKEYESAFPKHCYFCGYYRYMRRQHDFELATPDHDPCKEKNND